MKGSKRYKKMKKRTKGDFLGKSSYRTGTICVGIEILNDKQIPFYFLTREIEMKKVEYECKKIHKNIEMISFFSAPMDLKVSKEAYDNIIDNFVILNEKENDKQQ